MRGGDDFSLHPRFSPDDSEDDSPSSLLHRRAAAKSTLSESWRLYLMQVPRVSERIAMCVTKEYPSFKHLWDAYQRCAQEKQREMMLQVRTRQRGRWWWSMHDHCSSSHSACLPVALRLQSALFLSGCPGPGRDAVRRRQSRHSHRPGAQQVHLPVDLGESHERIIADE